MPETTISSACNQTLTQAGLTPDQATIYEYLLKNGTQPAGYISLHTPIKRGLVYKLLEQLENSGLVVKDGSGKVTKFEPAHPFKLKELAEQKEREAKNAQVALEGVLGSLASEYNLAAGKPGVQFFEGMDGVKRVLADSLRSRSEIYTYADIEAIVKYIDKINQEYVAKRERLKIKKKALLLDTPFAQNYLSNYHRDITDIKLVRYDASPFQTVMQIYDNKVSYITLDAERMIGLIINDPHIYETHKFLFEYMWQKAQTYQPNLQPPQQVNSNSITP